MLLCFAVFCCGCFKHDLKRGKENTHQVLCQLTWGALDGEELCGSWCCCDCLGHVFMSTTVKVDATTVSETNLHVAEHLGVWLPTSPPPLSPRQPTTVGCRGPPKKSAQNWDSTSKWTESEKCRKMQQKPCPEPPQRRHETLSMNESEDPPTVTMNWNPDVCISQERRPRHQLLPHPRTAPV